MRALRHIVIGALFGLTLGLPYELILRGPAPALVTFALCLVGMLGSAAIADSRSR